MQEIDLIDYIQKLKRLRLPSIAVTNVEEQLAWRRYGFSAWRRGEIPFVDALRNVLPGRYKSTQLQHALQASFDRHLDNLFKKEGLYEKATTLFGIPFSAVSAELKSWRVALKLINEVVIEDEYCAKKFVTKDTIVIDAGANIGTFTALSASIARDGHVYAFEPTSTTFEILQANVRSYRNVTVVQSALGDHEGSTELLIGSRTGEGNTLSSSGMKGTYSSTEIVRVTTIDAFVQEKKLPRVDFIKIDTEGFEHEILEGAAETIKKFHPTLALSAYHKPGDVEKLREIILDSDRAYRCRVKTSPEKDLICTISR